MNIEKRGKSYRITVSVGTDSNGNRIRERVTFNPDPNLTSKQAEQAAFKYGLEIENKLKRGGSVRFESLTFNQFADMYFKDHAPELKEYTAVQYKDIYEKRLKAHFGNMRIKNITALDVRQWLTELEKSNTEGKLKDNSKGVYFRTLSAMLGVAVRWEIIDDNPCRRVKTPRSKQSQVKALQIEDVNKLLSNIDSYNNSSTNKFNHSENKLQSVILIYIILYTGIREGEAAGLKWSDIDFDNRIMHVEREVVYIPKQGIRVTPPKSINSIRDVYIPEVLCGKLKKYKTYQNKIIKERDDLYNDEGYIITQFDGSPVHASSIRKSIKRVSEYCGVPYVTVHGLRHTYASLLIANGTDPRTAAAQLGHSTPSLTMNTYANPQNEAKRRAADFMETIGKTKR